MKSLKIEAIKTFCKLQKETLKNSKPTENTEFSRGYLSGNDSAYSCILDYIKLVEEME